MSAIETHTTTQAYFFELLQEAQKRFDTKLSTQTEAYLVRMLSSMRPTKLPAEQDTLFHRFAQALEAEDVLSSYRQFRALGDTSLRSAGWFCEHLDKRGLTLRYVTQMGMRAYDSAQSLAQSGITSSDVESHEVFSELACRFEEAVLLLGDVRESTTLRTPQDVVKLYDRWKKTGSPVLAARLRDEGVYPQAHLFSLTHKSLH